MGRQKTHALHSLCQTKRIDSIVYLCLEKIITSKTYARHKCFSKPPAHGSRRLWKRKPSERVIESSKSKLLSPPRRHGHWRGIFAHTRITFIDHTQECTYKHRTLSPDRWMLYTRVVVVEVVLVVVVSLSVW